MSTRMLLILILLSLISSAAFASRDEGMIPSNGFFLSQGSSKAGQMAFSRLKCDSCHWVQNGFDFKAPVTDKAGPVLGSKQAAYSPGWIANSIVSPSHTIALNSNGESEGSELSRMGDFKDSMTVRELMDIVSYLRSLGDQGSSAESN